MKETHYPEALAALAGGFTLLSVSVLNTILNHKALTALILSLIANICLILSLINARAERDYFSASLYQTEVQLSQVRIHCGLD